MDVRPAEIKAGVDTRATVTAKLGTPTATSTFDKNVWFYMSQLRGQTGFYKPKTLSRDIVAITFDPDTQAVTSVKTFTLANGRVFAYNKQETPTRGREMTVLEQLLGSISAGSVLPNTQEQSPGQH
ncbi:MAG: outer membrane protein assembly factor BamE domain-containing protein, partial [Caulobacteraceae bacterium]